VRREYPVDFGESRPGFSLLVGRMTYPDQKPGAHLIYDVWEHHLSVFVFQERFLRARLDEDSLSPKNLSFNMETWSQGGLRYFVIGDTSAADINSLRNCLKPPRHRFDVRQATGYMVAHDEDCSLVGP